MVTGASAGIGRATAERFGRRGDRVALIARGEDGLRGAAEAIERAGGTALVLQADVADFEAVDRAAERAEAELGPIDVWVNVAFTSVFAPFTKITPAEFKRVTEVSYLGYVHGTMAALQRMVPRDRGTIVQVGSALGYRAIPLQSAYCGAKHAVNGFTESVRCELLHDHSNVKITIVQMPAVNTPQFSWVRSRLPRHPQPVPPIYEPEVAAEGVVFAADHPDRKEYWVGGSTAATIFAQKFAAPLLDRYLGKTGYDSQQTDQPEPAGRPDNLWQPVDQAPGSDHGAHGEFDEKSRCAQRAPGGGGDGGSGRRGGHPRIRLADHHGRSARSDRHGSPAPAVIPAQSAPLADLDFPAVDEVTAAVYEVNTDRPEADGTLAWSKTTLITARVTAGGTAGLGYTYASGACKPLIEGELAAAVTGRSVLDTGAAWQAMVRAVRNLGRPGLVSCAISAVDTALWDLKAKLLDLPVSGLLGQVRKEVPVYGSGGFTTYDEPAAGPSSSAGRATWASPGSRSRSASPGAPPSAATWPGSPSPGR